MRAVKALGAGGQIITLVRELDLVVAFCTGNYSSRVQMGPLDGRMARDQWPLALST